MYCYLCNNVYVGLLTTKYHCEDCLKIKRYINLYNGRCLEILDSVLGRDIEKQKNKEKVEIIKEIEDKKKDIGLNESSVLYDNKDRLIEELKGNIKKSKMV